MPALLVWVGLANGVSAQTDCARALDLVDQGQGVRLAYTAPCDPYAPLELSYGQIQIQEETDWKGNLVMALPRLIGASSLTIQHGETLLSAAVPPSQVASVPYVAINWPEGKRFGTLEGQTQAAAPFGFQASDGRTHLDLLAAPDLEGVWLTIPVTEETCAKQVEGQVIGSSQDAPQTLSLTMPSCDAVGQALRIPLG